MATQPRTDLLVFARFPVPGRVKTRLARTTSDAFAADLYEVCLRGVLSALGSVPARRTVWVADAHDLEAMATLVGPAWQVRAQPEGDLTHRLNAAFEEAFSGGAERVVVTATDTPGLDEGLVREAHEALLHHEAVLGPASDGGYYLLGLSRWPVPVFEAMPWSTERVAGLTRSRLREAACSLYELPILPDLDTEGDLRAWCEAHPDGALARWIDADGRLG